jgi:hypothetical protein
MKKTITLTNYNWQKWRLLIALALNISALHAQVYFSEGFSSASGDTLAPTGWANDPNGNALGWNVSNPGGQSISGAGFSGNYYIVDATTVGRFSFANATLTSPYINLYSSSSPYIKFSEQFRFGSSQTANLSFSIDSGINWISILNYTNQSIGYPNPVTTAIACPQAARQPGVLFRWTFTRNRGGLYWWAIDSVVVGDASAPAVITGDTSNITGSAATLGGRITFNGDINISQYGILISKTPNPIIGQGGVIDSFKNTITDTGSYTLNFARLTKGTLYYYRAYAINAVGTTYGADGSFTTSTNTVLADVKNLPVRNITKNSAIVGGFIKSDGGEPVTESGIIYSTSPVLQISTPGIVKVVTTPTVDLDSFNLTLSGLSNGTKYYFRSYAKNLHGEAYGATDSFITLYLINSFPYHENFDTVTTSWLAYARGSAVNTWKCGIPTKTYLDSAYSKPNAWFTNISGQNADCFIESPEIDFSVFTGTPTLSFWHKFDLADELDAVVIEISTNNGATYTTLSDVTGTGSNYNTNSAYAWYNFDYWSDPIYSKAFTGLSTSYSSQVNGWIHSSAALTPAAGRSSVKIRIRFYAYNSIKEGIAIDDIRITPPSLPSVLTLSKANITNVSATLNGEVTNDGGDEIFESGVVYAVNPNPTLSDSVVSTKPLVSLGKYKLNLESLQPSTTYHYRAYTANSMGTVYGADSFFTTNAFVIAPIVDTYKPQEVYASIVTLGGNIPSNGGAPVSESGVVIATIANPEVSANNTITVATDPVVNIDSFYVTADSLAPQTRYYYRAYAINTVDTAYGILDSFTTEKLFSILPYTEKFDSVSTSWKSKSIGGNGINDWHLGTPAKTYIDSAYSAPNAWVTKLSGNFTGGVDCVLESPEFNFSSLKVSPIIVFQHKFNTNYNAAMVVEMSVNNGPYQAVDDQMAYYYSGTPAKSEAWYNTHGGNNPSVGSIVSYCFSGYSSYYINNHNWVRSAAVLAGANGAQSVRIRFRFTSGSSDEEGFAIDDIQIMEDIAPVVVTRAAINITTTKAQLNGQIAANGKANIIQSGFVFDSTANPTINGVNATVISTNPVVSNQTFSAKLVGLTIGQQYHYRTYALLATDTIYGTNIMFNTLAHSVVPVVANISKKVKPTEANIHLEILTDGGDTITASGVIYSQSSSNLIFGDPGVTNVNTNPMDTIGITHINIMGLTHTTKYYYRAFATNIIGHGYGLVDSFITSPVISLLPYAQNFETDSVEWESDNNGNTNQQNIWERGLPVKAYLNGAHSGTKAWATLLNQGYSNGYNAALVSPQFDFSSLTASPVLRFYHKFEFDPYWDYGVVQISVNNGLWTTLDNNAGTTGNYNTDSSFAWYNTVSPNWWIQYPIGFVNNSYSDTGSRVYTSNNNGWIQSVTLLTGAAGQANVRFRFLFNGAADGTEGWVIDDIEVVEQPVTPTNIVSSVDLSGMDSSTIHVSCTKGNGQGRLIVARISTTNPVAPLDNKLYRANTVFGAMDSTGLGNYVIYSDTGSSVRALDLAPYTQYAFDAYEYNGKYMHIKFAPAFYNSASTLPVNLVTFTAIAQSNNVVLNWVTASEITNKGFYVERSIDGRNFESINFVKGADNSNKTTGYSLTDKDAFANSQQQKTNSQLFYRLKQVDFNGKYTYSNIVRVTKNTQVINGLSVFPNPYSTEFNVSFVSTIDGNASFEMMDVRGKLVASQNGAVTNGENSVSINGTADLKAGVYFIRVTMNNEPQMLKLIKY